MTDSQIDAPMSEQAMPVQIWADPPETFDGMDMWRSEPGGKSVRYIRATPTVLAADPAVKALIADAEARAAREAYRKACVAVQIVISRNTPDDGGDADPCLIDQLEAVEGLIKREAAALRGETP